MACFVHFDLDMCFAPQRRAFLQHLNFQKFFEPLLSFAFWLPNVLRATTACNFSSLIWPDGPAPAALAILFNPPEPQIIGKTANRDFRTFSRTCLFLLPSLSPLWSSHFFSSPLWLSPPLLFHLSIVSEDWPLNFRRPLALIYQILHQILHFIAPGSPVVVPDIMELVSLG